MHSGRNATIVCHACRSWRNYRASLAESETLKLGYPPLSGRAPSYGFRGSDADELEASYAFVSILLSFVRMLGVRPISRKWPSVSDMKPLESATGTHGDLRDF